MQTTEEARGALEETTGTLFGKLWHRYNDTQFKASVEMFQKRWLANGEPPDFFRDKACLDAGCGGGRYSVAMALMGAKKVIGVDVGTEGLKDAKMRAESLRLSNVEFKASSVLDLSFPDQSFDFVCCCGVLHHTIGIERGLSEISRLLRPGGSAYLLLYGSGGVYWPLNLLMRSTAHFLGFDEVDRCAAAAQLPANKRRTVLDDLFVPVLETYPTERVDFLLRSTGFANWRRWKCGQMDHEASAQSMLDEIIIRERMWAQGSHTAASALVATLEEHLAAQCSTVIGIARKLIAQEEAGTIGAGEARAVLVGTGHHRIMAQKG